MCLLLNKNLCIFLQNLGTFTIFILRTNYIKSKSEVFVYSSKNDFVLRSIYTVSIVCKTVHLEFEVWKDGS